MGGRGASIEQAGGGNINVRSVTSLISQRERQQQEVDKTLSVLSDVERRYNVVLEDVQLAKMGGASQNVMAYYDIDGNLAVNEKYFDSATMDAAYDSCVQAGFHPSRGNKTGLEAVVAHEMGHRLTDIAGINSGRGKWAIENISNYIVQRAANSLGMSQDAVRSSISGYAAKNSSECVAEAFADVYCNGNNASAASRAIVEELNKFF